MSEKQKIEFHDKRRIKSVEDTCDDAETADLERLPTYVEMLQGQMEARDSQLKEYIAAYKEKMAEMDKVRKRLEDEADKRAMNRFGELIVELLPVMDDFDRAIETAKESHPGDPLLKGVEMLRARLMEALTKQGLESIDCQDKPFDPEIATAVGALPVEDDALDNIVLEQMAPGYRFGERVLRPAVVRIGQKQ